MYLQFQFISYYKIRNTKILTDINENNAETPPHVNILTTNIHIFYIFFFFIKINKTYVERAADSHEKYKYNLTFFFLPTSKRSTIFLRAPYKNKLARLNIVKIQYKMLLTLKYTPIVIYTQSVISSFMNYFFNLNISSCKIKHTKTMASFFKNSSKNFNIKNFN